MLFSLLFDANGQLAAAAPAVDVAHFGPQYWRDIYPQELRTHPDMQTGILHVDDPVISQWLESLACSDVHLAACRRFVNQSMFAQDTGPTSPETGSQKAA